MAEKVVGFQIEIKGNKELLTTEKLLGLVNEQLVSINENLDEINKKGGASLGKISKQFKEAATSAEKLGSIVKNSFQTFEKGNKVVKGMGKEYSEVTDKVEELGEEFTDNSKSIKELIERNKELKKTLQDAPIDDTSEELAELREEYSNNRDAIFDFNKELRVGVKQSELSEDSILGLRQTVKELTKEYNQLSKEAREGTDGKEVQKNLANTVKELKTLEEAVGDNRRSVGDYKKAFEGLGGVFGPFEKALAGVRQGFSLLVKNPLLAVLTAIVSVITGLVAAFKSTKEGAEAFAVAGAAIGAALDVVRDIAVTVGKALVSLFTDPIGSIKAFGTAIKDGFLNVLGGAINLISATGSALKSLLTLDFDGFKQAAADAGQVLKNGFNTAADAANVLTGAVSNTTDEIIREAKEAARLTGILNDLTDVQRDLSVQRAKLNAELVEARAISRDTTKSIEERVQALNKVRDAEKAQLALEIDAQTKRLNALKALAAQSDSDKETLDALAQAEIQLANLRKQSASTEISIQRELDRLTNERQKAIEKEKKDRTDLLKQIQSNGEARIQLTIELNNKLVDLEVQSIENAEQKALEAERLRFQRQRQARLDAFNELKKDTKAQEDEVIRLFGARSEELKAFQLKTGAEILSIKQQTDRLIEAEAKQHQENLDNITKTGIEQRKAIVSGGFASTLSAFRSGFKQIAEITKKGQEEAAIAEAEANAKRRKQAKEVVALVNVTLDGISQISNAAFQAEDQRFQESLSRRQENIQALNEDLQNATGLQKKFLKQQIEQEKKALDEETEAREKARKEQAKAQQAIAITQAIIGAALGFINAFQLGPPASFIAAAATAVATVAQIGVIASQKFAKGGVLSGPSHAQGGIKTSFGELEGGEAVINKNSTAKFKPLLSKINVAGGGKKFAEGGLLGAPISAPSLSSGRDANQDFNTFLQQQQAQTEAINARFDRIQVIQDLNNLEDIQDNDSTLNTLTTFN